MVMCRISTGVSAIDNCTLVELVEDREQDVPDQEQKEHSDHRREIQRTDRRDEPPEKPNVGLAHVVEETLDPVQPGRVGQPHPTRQYVREDQDRVDPDKYTDELLDARDRVGEHVETGGCHAHGSGFGSRAGIPRIYAWLKKPPPSNRRARSSAETSTLRGVRRKTLSATRCMPPSRAYVRPLVKSIKRFESSWSAPWRLRITGIPSLKRSAICWASWNVCGTTRCTRTEGTAVGRGNCSTSARLSRRRVGLTTAVRAKSASASGSVQSSNSCRPPRGDNRRTLGRSL